MYDPRDRVFSSSNAQHVSATVMCVGDRRGALRTDRAVVRGRAIPRCSSSVTGVCVDSETRMPRRRSRLDREPGRERVVGQR
jgi:hypothetical protein